jgi:DNA-binding transcriptional ArsR family regulator
MVDNKAELMDRVFYALSNTTRRNILLELTKKDLTVNELADKYDMTLQGVSKHIHVLVNSGLVSQEKKGRTKHCKFNYQRLSKISELLQQYRAFWERRLDALDNFIKERNKEKNES